MYNIPETKRFDSVSQGMMKDYFLRGLSKQFEWLYIKMLILK